MKDTISPDRLVVGTADPADEAILRDVYSDALGRDTPWINTDFETAELVKVAANAFLATKISFINAFSEVTEAVGGNITTLADAIGHDTRIGRKFLNAGVGFGGGCLPKDIRALQTRVGELGLDHTMRFLDEMDQINLRRRDRVVNLAENILSGTSPASASLSSAWPSSRSPTMSGTPPGSTSPCACSAAARTSRSMTPRATATRPSASPGWGMWIHSPRR